MTSLSSFLSRNEEICQWANSHFEVPEPPIVDPTSSGSVHDEVECSTSRGDLDIQLQYESASELDLLTDPQSLSTRSLPCRKNLPSSKGIKSSDLFLIHLIRILLEPSRFLLVPMGWPIRMFIIKTMSRSKTILSMRHQAFAYAQRTNSDLIELLHLKNEGYDLLRSVTLGSEEENPGCSSLLYLFTSITKRFFREALFRESFHQLADGELVDSLEVQVRETLVREPVDVRGGSGHEAHIFSERIHVDDVDVTRSLSSENDFLVSVLHLASFL
ncbi:hypothetical protein OSB04_023989 [Centaurea solstitialis]|uniref:Uncharacterized protein n=1 Tax=Centaurea solstitialis TaxID=347529 RepID=A0AA38W072_9ASTR|nr:hypothetical protein OSB04_023989 [Centaurea solstitialis]